MDVRNISDQSFLEGDPEGSLSRAGSFEEPSPTAQTVYGAAILLAGLAGITGNSLALHAFFTCKTVRKPKHYLAVNLCVAGCLICVAYCPTTVWSSFIHTWPFGQLGCDIAGFSVGVMTMVLMTTQLAIAMQRLTVAINPLAAAATITHHKMLLIAAFTWVYSIVLMLPPLLGWNKFIVERSRVSVMFDYMDLSEASRAYVIALIVFAFVLPLIAIVCSYAYIFVAVRKSRKDAHVKRTLLSRGRDIKTAIVALSLSALFCASWAPYALVVILSQCKITVPITYLLVASAVAKCSTVINPAMFALSLPAVRRHYMSRQKRHLPREDTSP